MAPQVPPGLLGDIQTRTRDWLTWQKRAHNVLYEMGMHNSQCVPISPVYCLELAEQLNIGANLLRELQDARPR